MKLISAKTLRALMEQQGKSFADVGRYADVHRTFIWQLADGRRSTCKPAVAQRIADLLGVPLEILFEVRMSPAGGGNDARRKKVAA